MKIGPIDFVQPSTWRGILGVISVFGLAVRPELAEQIALTLGAGLSLIEMIRNEYAARHAPLLPIVLQSTPAAVAAGRLRPPVSAHTETAGNSNAQPADFGDR